MSIDALYDLGTKSCPEMLRRASSQWENAKSDLEELNRLKAAANERNLARENAVLTPEQRTSKFLLVMKEMQKVVGKEDRSYDK